MGFAEAFTKITVAKAEQLIENDEHVVIFVGRSTCPYCQRFEPKLTNVAKASGQTVYFINSEDVADLAAIQIFRNKYTIPTVPGLLVAHAGEVKVVCDSSLPEDVIAEFITN